MIRALKHFFHFSWQDPWLTDAALDELEAATTAAEQGHRGEIRLVIERRLPLSALRDSLRARAERHFATLGVWNTEERSGILIYLNLAERRLELIADTGIAAAVEPSTWQTLCQQTVTKMQAGEEVAALIALIEEIAQLLRAHYGQPDDPHGNELPNRPVIIG